MEKTLNQNVEKPFILDYEEATVEVVSAINEVIQRHGLPAYFMSIILDQVLSKLKEASRSELEAVKAQYASAREELVKRIGAQSKTEVAK